MKEKKSFILYLDNAKQVNMLTDEQAGKFIKAVYKFAETGEETEFDDIALNIVYSFIADNIKRDTAKYQETCMRRSENGKKGGRPPKAEKANGFSENQNKAKKADNDIDNENEIIKTFEKIQKSSFLKGNKNKSDKYKDWKANFSWLIKYDHFLNAFNGNYDNNSNDFDDDFDVDMYNQFMNDFTAI